MSASTAVTPDFKWAQNKEVVFLTVEITDPINVKVNLKPNTLSFSANSTERSFTGKDFSLDLKFLHEVDADASKIAIRSRGVELVLKKKDTNAEFWSHLLENHKEWKSHCHVDWSKWIDEDEDAEPQDDWRSKMADFNPIDFPDMGMGEFDNAADDSDDEEEEGHDEVPHLEETA
jgi:hypothetical protein